LKNHLQQSPIPSAPNQLEAIIELFVPPYNEIGEKALNCFLERNPMGSEFLDLEIVLKITGLEAIPIYQNISAL